MIDRAIAKRFDRFVAAIVDGRVAGYYSLGDADDAQDYLWHLYVDPAFQRRGVGRALLRHAERAIAARGHASARLDVLARNAKALAFYAAEGWVETGRETDGGLDYVLMGRGLGGVDAAPRARHVGAMTFSADAWAANLAAYETIRTMPFNAELAAGALSRDRFRHYVVQDAHYLIGFGRALAVAAAKAPDPDRIVQFAEAAKTAIVVERSLHAGFMRDYGISAEEFASTPVSPACQHYVSYLIATAHGEDHSVNLAALLPCFWIYAEVGRDIHARASKPNPYQAWIDTYAGEEFHAAVRTMIDACDEAAVAASPTTVVRMHDAYRSATRLEYLFWDSAYRLEAWPL